MLDTFVYFTRCRVARNKEQHRKGKFSAGRCTWGFLLSANNGTVTRRIWTLEPRSNTYIRTSRLSGALRTARSTKKKKKTLTSLGVSFKNRQRRYLCTRVDDAIDRSIDRSEIIESQAATGNVRSKRRAHTRSQPRAHDHRENVARVLSRSRGAPRARFHESERNVVAYTRCARENTRETVLVSYRSPLQTNAVGRSRFVARHSTSERTGVRLKFHRHSSLRASSCTHDCPLPLSWHFSLPATTLSHLSFPLSLPPPSASSIVVALNLLLHPLAPLL